MSAIRLMFAMRSEFFRESFARLLQVDAGLQVSIAGGCTFADEVEPLFNSLVPDILIMDIKLYRGDSLKVMHTLLRQDKTVKIIGVSESYKHDISDSLEEIGAQGYLLRNDDINMMKEIILGVFNGKRMLKRGASYQEDAPG